MVSKRNLMLQILFHCVPPHSQLLCDLPLADSFSAQHQYAKNGLLFFKPISYLSLGLNLIKD